MTSALNIPKALSMPPSTMYTRSSGPPTSPAISAQEPVSQALGLKRVIAMAATGKM